MSDIKISGKSVLEIKGKGVIIDAEGEGSYFYGVIKSDLRVYLNGNEITDSVKWEQNYVAFLANKILGEESYPDFYISEELELPTSVFFLPEDADPNLIELLPIKDDFSDLYEDGTVADFVIYDGEEYEANSYYNEERLIDNIEVDGISYNCNRDLYSENYEDLKQTHLFD